MPYAAPSTVSAGQIYTPTMYNSFVQGNADSGFMRKLADTTLGAPAATIDFSSIPTTMAHLMLVVKARGSAASPVLAIRMNGDSGANYEYVADYTSNTSGNFANALAQTSGALGLIPGSGATALRMGAVSCFIPYYLDATNHKAYAAMFASPGGAAASMFGGSYGGAWASAAAVNQLTLIDISGGNLTTGTRATLYGMPV